MRWDHLDRITSASFPTPMEPKPRLEWSGFTDYNFEVLSIIIGNFVGQLLDLFDRNKPHTVSNFLQASDLESLP